MTFTCNVPQVIVNSKNFLKLLLHAKKSFSGAVYSNKVLKIHYRINHYISEN